MDGATAMDSPFPGMDPYLERHWGDVHQRLVTYACDQLQDRLPFDLRARMQERLVIAAPAASARVFYPDVRVVERPGAAGLAAEGGVAVVVEPEVAVAQPLVISYEATRREGFIEIVEAGRRERVVTVVEVLSPSNKQAGGDQDQYLSKREDLWRAGVSLVEIDLLRGGRRVPMCPLEWIPESYRTAYQVAVRRGWGPARLEVYGVPLRERLPVIGIPLRSSDRDVALDLQVLVRRVYRNGRYDDIDYRLEPEPPLGPDDAAWADTLLRDQGKR
jgi:hypothetical protein